MNNDQLELVSFTGPVAPVRMDIAVLSSANSASFEEGTAALRALYCVTSSFGSAPVTRYRRDGGRGRIVHAKCTVQPSYAFMKNAATSLLIAGSCNVGCSVYLHADTSTVGSSNGHRALELTHGTDSPVNVRLDAGFQSLSIVATSFWPTGPTAGVFGSFFANLEDLTLLGGDFDLFTATANVQLLIRWDGQG